MAALIFLAVVWLAAFAGCLFAKPFAAKLCCALGVALCPQIVGMVARDPLEFQIWFGGGLLSGLLAVLVWQTNKAIDHWRESRKHPQ